MKASREDSLVNNSRHLSHRGRVIGDEVLARHKLGDDEAPIKFVRPVQQEVMFL